MEIESIAETNPNSIQDSKIYIYFPHSVSYNILVKMSKSESSETVDSVLQKVLIGYSKLLQTRSGMAPSEEMMEKRMKEFISPLMELSDKDFFEVVGHIGYKDVLNLILEGRKNREFEKYMKRKTLKDSYEESDQSPLTGIRAQYLEIQLRDGLDFVPYLAKNSHLSDWLREIWIGDYHGMMRILEKLDKHEIKKMLKKRETMKNVCAIFFVIDGAKKLNVIDHPKVMKIPEDAKRKMGVKNDHIKILKKLVSLGADVNARDIAGFTPLHYCVSQLSQRPIITEMATILFEAGADVDAQNRFGATPLLESMKTNRLDFIGLMLTHGADPFLYWQLS